MKLLLFAVFLLFASAAYYLCFSPRARKASFVFDHYGLVKEGFTQAEVVRILTPPDTAYWTMEFSGDSVYALDYDMGDLAPDNVRVYLKNGRVTSIIYCN